MWALSPGVRHLNHGSFGAVPIPVREDQARWRALWDADPTGFVYRDLVPGLERSRIALSGFLGADPRGLAFVRNASQGVASVIRSIEDSLTPGDEIVTTSHDYNAVRQTLEFSARRTGAKVRVVAVPFPIEDPADVTRLVCGAVGERTRLVVLDHITSPTALVYPVEEIVSVLEPEVPVLVDGAHGPGQVALDLDDLGASWYTGNLHKWVCAPHGAAFLHTRSDRLDQTVPTVISHAWNAPLIDGASRYLGLFDWTGTDDFSPWLVIPEALEVVGALEPGGWPALIERNHQLALAARSLLCTALEISSPAPDSMIGTMAAVPLPDFDGADPGGLLSPLNDELIDDGFETIVGFWPGWPYQVLRISAHHYNDLGEYQALAEHLSDRVG